MKAKAQFTGRNFAAKRSFMKIIQIVEVIITNDRVGGPVGFYGFLEVADRWRVLSGQRDVAARVRRFEDAKVSPAASSGDAAFAAIFGANTRFQEEGVEPYGQIQAASIMILYSKGVNTVLGYPVNTRKLATQISIETIFVPTVLMMIFMVCLPRIRDALSPPQVAGWAKQIINHGWVPVMGMIVMAAARRVQKPMPFDRIVVRAERHTGYRGGCGCGSRHARIAFQDYWDEDLRVHGSCLLLWGSFGLVVW